MSPGMEVIGKAIHGVTAAAAEAQKKKRGRPPKAKKTEE